jgi:hypothetical protein
MLISSCQQRGLWPSHGVHFGGLIRSDRGLQGAKDHEIAQSIDVMKPSNIAHDWCPRSRSDLRTCYQRQHKKLRLDDALIARKGSVEYYIYLTAYHSNIVFRFTPFCSSSVINHHQHTESSVDKSASSPLRSCSSSPGLSSGEPIRPYSRELAGSRSM